MTLLLLTGAGFSRNWGGWLANEVFEYLIGEPSLSPRLRELLWVNRRKGGFEGALGQLQMGSTEDDTSDLRTLMVALAGMFNTMNEGLKSQPFDNQDGAITSFLGAFEAIFTLNQDLLLEHLYQGPRGLGFDWYLPGLRPRMPINRPDRPMASFHEPDPQSPGPWDNPRLQPYYKLHGSSGFFDPATSYGGQMLIVGGGKAGAISRSSLLKAYSDAFKQYLSRPRARLVVVGYGFGDEHINNALRDAAVHYDLRIFIVDPAGADVIERDRDKPQPKEPDAFFDELHPHVVGASRRSLKEIFGSDTVERSKLSRFMQRET